MAKTKKFKVGDKIYNIPEEKAEAFQKAHPNASVIAEETTTRVGSPEVDHFEPATGKTIDATKNKRVKDSSHNPGEEKRKSQDQTETAQPDAEGNIPIIIRPYYGSDAPTAYTPAEWQEFAKSTGFKPTTKSIGAQNKEFQDYLAKHPDWKDEIEALHKKHGPPKEGKFDSLIGKRWDAIYKKPEPKTPEEKVTINPAPAVVNDPRKPWVANTPYPVRRPASAPWWLQDIVKTSGAAADLMSVKKYLPWQATPEVKLPDATFYDPTRELAANAEQANIQTQGMASFTSPQQLAAMSSSIQGQALKNAADIESRYNNLNVGIANQLNQERTGIMNQASQNKANLDTHLFDAYTIANQQFDNSKLALRQNLRQSYIDAITNRAKAQALNSLYPNYHTNPMTGGMVDFIGGSGKINPNHPNFSNDYYTALSITGDPDRALKYLQLQKTGKIDDNTDQGYLPQQGYPGGQNISQG